MSRSRVLAVHVFLLLAALPAGAAEPVSPTAVLAKLSNHGPVYLRERAQPTEGDDRTLAPYLVVAGAGDGERLPLKETGADVSIAGVIARVRVHQVFANDGQKPIEAVYVFPASTRAAVHGMRMKIGQRVVEAKIDRKQAARATYEAARQAGQRTSLLEQERPNVFTMSVANILPGDRIAVELDYSELLVPEDATYEFVYPTVVGPRYGGGADPQRDRWIANPYLGAGQPEPYKFDLRVHVETGIPLKELGSPSHEVKVAYAGPARADVTLVQPGGGNRDFVLRYRLAGDKVETGALIWDGPGKNGQRESFFAVMVEPPRKPAQAMIPPREYIFLLDVSGSMHGYPLATAKTLMHDLLGRLRTTDRFDVVLFSGAFATLAPQGSLPATADNIARAIAYVDQQRGGGGTELMGGLEACYAIPHQGSGISRSVVVVTDGFVGVEAQAFRFIRDRLNDANLFAFGIGSSVNRGLIEGMARAGMGEPFVVLNPQAAPAAAAKLRAYIEQPVLTDIHVDFRNVDAVEVAPGHIPDLMAHRPLVVYGKLRGSANGRIVLSGLTGQGRFEQAVVLRQADLRAENQPLRWLWARKWVETLEDERHMGGAPALEDAITRLGLDYDLLTAFTSFVAVDSAVVNKGGAGETVKQPLPLPEGVSEHALNRLTDAQASPAMLAPEPARKARVYEPAPRQDKSDDALEGAMGYGAGAGSLGSVKGVAGGGATGTLRSLGQANASAAPPAERAGVGGKKAKEAKQELASAEASKTSSPVKLVRSAGLGETAPLLAQLEALIHEAGCRGGVTVVRLTIDATGKLTKIELVRGDARTFACLRLRLEKLTSRTHATATSGTIEVIIRS